MAVYCFSYDLNKTGQNYSALYEELKKSSGWWHNLDSTWLISTHETSSQLYERIRKHTDDNDRFIIIRVTNDYTGWLSEEAWKWMREHI